MIALARWLDSQGAYRDVVAWAERYGGDWGAAWAECPRGDWLLAIAATLEDTDRRALVAAACACAELALEAGADPGAVARRAVSVALAWAGGSADDAAADAALGELEGALAFPADPAQQETLSAAYAALSARRSPRDAPAAAAHAVQANVLATGECALETVVRYAHATSADRVRAALPAPAARG